VLNTVQFVLTTLVKLTVVHHTCFSQCTYLQVLEHTESLKTGRRQEAVFFLKGGAKATSNYENYEVHTHTMSTIHTIALTVAVAVMYSNTMM
jgi:hypothetical protein